MITKKELWQTNGEYYGYPDCCTLYFAIFGGEKISEARSKASNHTGFVPCEQHANRILRGEITLKSLIKNRQCKKPFPKEDESEITKLFWAQYEEQNG